MRLTLLTTLVILGCGKPGNPPAASSDRVQKVVLKFQDSLGGTETVLPGDGIGPNLRDFIAAMRAAPDSDAALKKDPADSLWNDDWFSPRPSWWFGIQRMVDSTWVEAYLMKHSGLGDSLESPLEQEESPDPRVEIRVTLHVRKGITERITVDSVGPRYAGLAATLANRGLDPGVPLADGAYPLRLIGFNFFLYS